MPPPENLKPRLGVNVDHVATVRQARGGRVPDPAAAALLCQRAGAHGIVVHLREDRRHIQEKDVRRLRKLLRVKLNLEMSAHSEIVRIACQILPDQATLVPEKRQELTTEGGLDLLRGRAPVARAVEALLSKKISVSLFIDPHPRQLEAARALGALGVELHTGAYANAATPAGRRREIGRLRTAARMGRDLGLEVYAGHGLDYDNVRPVARIPEVEELNIGHSIISRAIFVGIGQAVRDMLTLL